MTTLAEPYLLSVSVPMRVDREGVRWTDRLWAKDLALHTDYIDRLTLVSPRLYSPPLSTDVALNKPPFDKITFIDLPVPKSHMEAVRLLPETASKMWSAVSVNKIIHTGFGFWPISEGLFACPIALLKRKFLITFVESSNWRAGNSAALHNRIRSSAFERLHRVCVQRADLRFFTSQAYRNDFLPPGADRFHVAPASWIDEENIISEQSLTQDWARRKGPLKFLFAGRLTKEKGLQLFLETASELKRLDTLSFSVIGDGPLKFECEQSSDVVLLDTVPYGPAFFSLLRGFDAVVVPSISDEQPRIIFDAFSQGIPILGSRTGGIEEVVKDGFDGLLFAPSSRGLLETILKASANRVGLQTMGLNGLRKSRDFTHRGMHARRSQIIRSALEAFEAHGEH